MNVINSLEKPSFVPGRLLRELDVTLLDLASYRDQLGQEYIAGIYANDLAVLEYYFLIDAKIESMRNP